MAQSFRQIEDPRQAGKIDHCLHDVLMSGFAMMFFQDPSILSFQKRLQEGAHCNNLTTVFNVGSIPKETQMRDVTDSIPTEELSGIFPAFLHELQRGRQLSQYQLLNGKYLVALDGSEYFSSDKVSCPRCLKKEPAKGNIRYHHQILQAVIVHPGSRQVLPFFPEPIQNSDGTDKQDCETNAGKRTIAKIRKAHPKLPIIITADDLYSKQPFVDALKGNDMSFILVAKPSDHKILFEWVEEFTNMGGTEHLEIIDKKGRYHRYEWVSDVPLNGAKNASQVNFFQYRIVDGEKVTYRNSWVTDIAIDQNNIVMLVKAGRARWKIENETFNTLKNQGYHIEHNYGHGSQYLSMNFFVLNLLAFYVHQILELCDLSYQRCRGKFSSRKEYWNQLRCTLRIILFRDLYHLLDYIFESPMIRAP
ncbi:MAG: hypothetical protein Q8P24_05590 [Desulfobacterales bacterium]|nr:hypothetical protein [Desulfobacterales bacterium]